MANTQASVENALAMASDKTAMQDKDTTYSAVSTGTDITFAETSASTTSGALTTVDAATGIITIGRDGKFKLTMNGSFQTSGATALEFQIHLDTTGVGDAFIFTGFGSVNTVSANAIDDGFSAAFHGTRSTGDLIKVVMVSSAEKDIIIDDIGIMTEWMT